MQNLGVLVFFVLSGFLIAHLLNRGIDGNEYTFGSFCIDRLARIYSAYLPALVFIAILDGMLVYLGRFEYESHTGWKNFLGNMVMLQNYPGPYRELIAVPSYGSAGQLWTLPIVFHIYLFVGAAAFFLRGKNVATAGLLLVMTAAVPLANFSSDPHGLPGAGLFILWLLGFAAYYVALRSAGDRLSPPVLAVALAILTWAWISNTVPGNEFHLESYFLMGVAFLFLIMTTQHLRFLSRSPTFYKAVRFAANYSYSLYLLHYSLLFFLHKFWLWNPVYGAILGIIISNAVAIPFAMATEFRHKAMAATFKSWCSQVLATAQSPAFKDFLLGYR